MCENSAGARKSGPAARHPGSGRVRNLRDVRKNARMCGKLCDRAKMRPLSCENAAPVALAICAIARQNCAGARKTARSRENPGHVVRKSGSGRVRNLCDCAQKTRECAKTCASARKSRSRRAEICFRSRQKFLRWREKTARACGKLRDRAKVGHRSCENPAPSALGISAMARKTARMREKLRALSETRFRSCGNLATAALGICPNVQKTSQAFENAVPVVQKFGPGGVRDLRDCAKKCARNCAIPRKFGPGRA